MFIFFLLMLFITVVLGVAVALASDAPALQVRPRLAGMAVAMFIFLGYSVNTAVYMLFVPDETNLGVLFWEVFAFVMALAVAFPFTLALQSRQRRRLQ